MPAGTMQIQYSATVFTSMPVGRNPIVNEVEVYAVNEPAAQRSDNFASNTVIGLMRLSGDSTPLIRAEPATIFAGDSVVVSVQVLVPVENWDLQVLFMNGRIDSSYADIFISQNVPVSNEWLVVQPPFDDTGIVSNADQEEIVFELSTIDVFGVHKTARAVVTVQNRNEFIIDPNVYNPSHRESVEIRFRLGTHMDVELNLFDVTGTWVSNLTRQQYSAGWNTFYWNGLTDRGTRVGSGTYLVTMQAGNFRIMKKLMVVR
jgi:hypothetical protein